MSSSGAAKASWSGKREHDRVSLSERVQYYVGDVLHTGELVDIAEGGLRLNGPDLAPLNSELKIFVAIPTGQNGHSRLCLFTGRVVWWKHGSMGIHFEDPPAESLAELRALARARNP